MEMRAESEAELEDRARGGDPREFSILVERHERPVRLYFALRVADPATVDDLVQQTFAAALGSFHTYDPGLPLYPWLKGIAANILRNERRRRRPDPLEGAVDELVAEEAESRDEEDVLSLLADCLAELPPAATRLVEARYREGLSLDELAAREERSVKAVGVALVRIRAALRRCMDSERERRER